MKKGMSSRLLVVDDEAAITTHLEERLNIMGYDVVGRASSGEEAVEMARRHKPDLVLMDIVMQGRLDGIEAARGIKAELDIPVVFLTAYGDDKFITRAKNVEPLGYVIKPFQDTALKATIEVALFNKNVSRRLRDSEEYWRLLAENISEGVILGDCHKQVFFWNRGAENIFHYTASEAMGRPLSFITPENFREECEKGLDDYLTTGRSGLVGRWLEVVGLRKNWSKFPLEVSFTPCGLKDKTFFICVVRDITERKRHEDGMKASLREKEVLLSEIQAQVRKNLQAIYSLIDLQFEFIKGKQALAMLKETRDRIQRIALMHEKLSLAKDLGKIDFANYVNNLAGRLLKAYEVEPDDVELRVDVQNVFLDVKMAISCGLIVSELVSNSLKYAFPSIRKGDISVCFLRDPEGLCTLTVKDNGIGFPRDLDFRRPKTLGLQMVNDLVAQLRGTINLDRRKGTKFRVLFEELKG